MRPSSRSSSAALVAVLAVAAAACGQGEDRPAPVTADTATATTASGSASGSVSASGAHSRSASGSVSGSVSASGVGGAPAVPAPPFRRSEADTVVAVTMEDFAYRFETTELTGPRIYVTLHNTSESLDHEFDVYLDDEKVLDLPPIPAGGYAETGLELEPGTYVARCGLAYGYETHASRGEVQEFTVS